jgi:hypothetical protein
MEMLQRAVSRMIEEMGDLQHLDPPVVEIFLGHEPLQPINGGELAQLMLVVELMNGQPLFREVIVTKSHDVVEIAEDARKQLCSGSLQ